MTTREPKHRQRALSPAVAILLATALSTCGDPPLDDEPCVECETCEECEVCDPPPCIPDCTGRCAGDDGCGGSCSLADCPAQHSCDATSSLCLQITVQDDGPVDCDATYVTGSGSVWRGDDVELRETRELPCLAGDGYLHGYYLPALTTSLDALALETGNETYAADHDYPYPLDDPRANEVEAYYLITHQAAWVARSLPTGGDFTAELDILRTDEIFLDYDLAVVESRQLCSYLLLGMQGLDRALVNRDVLTHEFGHHVLFAFNREVRNAMLHEGIADYLTAAFTRDSTIEPSSWSGFDRDADNDLIAPDDIISKETYCQSYLDQMVAAGLHARFPAVAEQFRSCLELPAGELAAPESHWAGQILAGALWDLRDAIGEESLNRLLFSALADGAFDDTGDLMTALLTADAALEGGAHATTITDTFTARGIDANLALGFPELPYHACP